MRDLERIEQLVREQISERFRFIMFNCVVQKNILSLQLICFPKSSDVYRIHTFQNIEKMNEDFIVNKITNEVLN